MYFAHSSNISRGTYSPQPYKEHVVNVFEKAQVFFKDSTKYSKLSLDEINFLLDVVSLSAIYHDLGKLSEQPQSILSKDYTENSDERMLNHVDAGVACLLKKYENSGNIAYLMAAFFVNAHHIGLGNFNTLIARISVRARGILKEIYEPKKKNFRDNRDIFETYGIGSQGTTVKDYVDQSLKNLEDIHDSEVGINYVPVSLFTDIPHPIHSISYRMAFSCLVDADHTDTELFYSNKNFEPFEFSKLRATERVELLQTYISSIPKDPSVSPERVENRKLLHDICHSSPIPKNISFFALDCPVGTGKTLNGWEYVLRLAIDRNCDRSLNIIPYTNIISQTVEVFRKSILFKNENEYNINEIHSKVEFDDVTWMRKYSHKWNAPINVSTMVQFAESLTSNRPSACRKLHWFSNSVIFFDEFDKSMAHENWEFFLEILKEMAENFNCTFVFASGTSAYYWEIFDTEINVHYIIDKKSARAFSKLERSRCKIKRISSQFTSVNSFVNHIFKNIKSKSNGVIVCNTINNACMLANQFRDNKKFSSYEIYELHGWQDPQLKESILEKIKTGLKDTNRKILVVATSTIECGVDLSFQIGWREKCGPLSLLQCIGRINRGGIDNNALCYVFKFHESLVGVGNPFTENPQLVNAIQVFDGKTTRQITPNRCTGFVTEEILLRDSSDGDSFSNYEANMDFKSMGDEFRVINSMTALVIVNPEIVNRIRSGEPVQSVEISRNSVQLWESKIEKIQKLFADEFITEIGENGYYSWEGDYESESGIGKSMLAVR
jgi:CRISPR-associated endonuclease Cas3-HD